MFNKRRVLYSAMAVALMSGGGSAWATTGLNMIGPGGATEAVKVASEGIVAGNTVGADASQLVVQYVLANDIAVDFDIFFTLSGGATWDKTVGGAVLSDSGLGVSLIGPNFDTTGSVMRWRVGAGNTNMTAVDGSGDPQNTLSLSFNIVDKLGVLGSDGGSISLSVGLQLTTGDKSPDPTAEVKEIPVLSSKDSQKLEMLAMSPAAKIDVASNSISFLVGSTNNSKATLGSIKFTNDPNYFTKELAGSFDPADLAATGATITVIDAPFNASLGGSAGHVFIDVNGSNSYDADIDLLATSITSNEATWSLVTADVDKLLATTSTCLTTTGCNIMIEADGTTSIEEASTAPTGAVTIEYGSIKKEANKKLAYIKRNGSVCTLYNIPNAAAVDELSIRLTNTGSKEGGVRGTLYGLDGVPIFNGVVLVDTLLPYTTVRLSADDVKTAAGGTDWAGRAVLTLSSTISEGSLEVFGLVRNKAGGPLMNLSAGATGNGCGN